METQENLTRIKHNKTPSFIGRIPGFQSKPKPILDDNYQTFSHTNKKLKVLLRKFVMQLILHARLASFRYIYIRKLTCNISPSSSIVKYASQFRFPFWTHQFVIRITWYIRILSQPGPPKRRLSDLAKVESFQPKIPIIPKHTYFSFLLVTQNNFCRGFSALPSENNLKWNLTLLSGGIFSCVASTPYCWCLKSCTSW